MKISVSSAVPSSISDVERDTGVAKETLRVWERRYAFPTPLRDAHGERVYPAEQVHKLRLVKRLIDLGFRPGKVIGQSSAELHALAEQSAGRSTLPAGAAVAAPELQQYLALCKTHQMETLRRKLSQAQMSMGLKRFIIELVAPLTTLVGEAWASGALAVFEEHLYTESIKIVLRSAIYAIPQAGSSTAAPRILLTTLPQERHALGLLMAEALAAAEGAHCISLGVQTPLLDIVEAARAQRADVVALSFSASMNPRQALDGLAELHAHFGGSVELWVGGACSALNRRKPPFARVLALGSIGAALDEWRQRHAQDEQPASHATQQCA